MKGVLTFAAGLGIGGLAVYKILVASISHAVKNGCETWIINQTDGEPEKWKVYLGSDKDGKVGFFYSEGRVLDETESTETVKGDDAEPDTE